MRVRVLQAFVDKYTDDMYDVGYEMDVTDDRGSEMVSAGVVEVIPEPTVKVKKSNKKQ